MDVLQRDRVVAVVRASVINDPGSLASALAAGRIRSVEFTFTTRGAEKIIRAASDAGTDAVIGAGTVLTAHQAHLAIDAGARFLVTPGLVPAVAAVAVARGVPIILGALTPTEVLQALDLGAAAVKIFPAASVGPEHIAAIRAALPGVHLLASGGVDESNASAYLRAGAFAVAAGSSVVSAGSIESGNWDFITERAQAFVDSFAAAY